MVTAASLCNQDEVERLGINVGDEVYVEKSAEIIPKVMGIHKKHSKGHWTMPEKCPCCHHKVVRPEGFVDFYCENNDCQEQVFARLKHATGKSALDIDGCGEVTVRELMDHGAARPCPICLRSPIWIFSSRPPRRNSSRAASTPNPAALAQDSRPGDRGRWPDSQPGHCSQVERPLRGVRRTAAVEGDDRRVPF
jgi:hypothetical protein